MFAAKCENVEIGTGRASTQRWVSRGHAAANTTRSALEKVPFNLSCVSRGSTVVSLEHTSWVKLAYVCEIAAKQDLLIVEIGRELLSFWRLCWNSIVMFVTFSNKLRTSAIWKITTRSCCARDGPSADPGARMRQITRKHLTLWLIYSVSHVGSFGSFPS